MSVWIDLVNGLTRSPPSLTVEIETFDKNAVVAEASDPYVTFAIQTQLNTFADVQPDSTQNMCSET